MLAIYGIDGNRVLQDSVGEDGYDVLPTPEELGEMDRHELAKVILSSGALPRQRKQWPEQFPIQQFLELYNAIVR